MSEVQPKEVLDIGGWKGCLVVILRRKSNFAECEGKILALDPNYF